MITSESILEQWIAGTIQSYPGATVPFLSRTDDPFRNPVGHALRESLTALFEQLQGNMDTERIVRALDAIIRIRAVQDFTASQAVEFVFLLRPLLREVAPQPDPVPLGASLHDRIDRLALMAFDQYMRCREQLADIRTNEARRRIHVRPVAG